MDVVTPLAAILLSGAKTFGNEACKDAYNKFKSFLLKKFPPVQSWLATHNFGNDAEKLELQNKLLELSVDKDQETLNQFKNLANLFKSHNLDIGIRAVRTIFDTIEVKKAVEGTGADIRECEVKKLIIGDNSPN